MSLSDFKPAQNGESPRKLNPLRPSNSVSKSAVSKSALSSTVANLLGPDADPNQFSATQLFSSMTLDRPHSEKVTGIQILYLSTAVLRLSNHFDIRSVYYVS